MISLCHSYISSNRHWEVAVPYLEDLSDKIGESSSLSILDETDIVYVIRIPVNNIMRHSLNVGARLPAYATSMGKVLLAHLPPEKLDAYFERAELKAFTEKTIISEQEIREQLKEIKETGWALSKDELELGLVSIAAPITDASNKVVAAINCSTHTGRTDIEKVKNEYLPELLATSKQISNNFDYELP